MPLMRYHALMKKTKHDEKEIAMKFRKTLSVLLALMLFVSLFSGSALAASGEASGGASGGGVGSAGQEFGTFTEVESSAGIVIKNGAVSYADGWNGSASGEITAEGMNGAVITADEANGIAITLANETDTYIIENSEIRATAGLKNNDLGYEAAYGVGVGVSTGELWIKTAVWPPRAPAPRRCRCPLPTSPPPPRWW